MKLSVFILLFAIIQVTGTEIYSQETRVSLSLRNTSLKDVLKAIEDKTGYYFMYSAEMIDVEQKIGDVSIENKNIFDTLKEILEDTDIEYTVKNRQILLSVENISGNSPQNVQQQRTISGRVTDSSGQPLPGVTVLVKGTTQGTITGAEGNYILSNVRTNATLVFSFVGMRPAELTVGERNTIDMVMQEETIDLDEVVAVGYGTMKKSDLTGSIASVSTKELVASGRADAVGAIQGALPGVQIQRSNNKPGGTYNILIRGLNTISGDTAPLVVVDGIPGASLTNLNPSDIEKIDILKDASSTAIYGSRATNGVVMVTTKRGQKGRVKIDYNGYAGYKNYTNLPDMMSGDEYVQLAREAFRAQNNNVYREDSEIFTPSELEAIKNKNYFDWVDAVSSTAFMTNHSLSATGGSDAATYAFSGGYYYEEGMLFPQEYTRYNLRTVIDVNVSKYFQFGANMYGVHRVRDTGNSDLLLDALRLRPTYHPVSLVTGKEEWSYSNGQYNALITMNNEFNQTKVFNFLGNIYLAITPVKGLTAKTIFSPNITIEQIGQYRGKYTKANKGTNNPTSNYAKNTVTNWIWDNMATYNWAYKAHRIDLMGAFSMQQSQTENLKGTGNYLSYNSLWYNIDGGTTISATSGYTQTNLMSYLFRANYVYHDKYFITASLRYDGSSKLAKGNKWGGFPSVAFAWRVSQESFMQNAGWVSNLKLRVSYGQTGNDNVNAYQTEGSLSGAKYYTFGDSDVIGYVPGNLRNLELGWERTTEYNIGLDYGFLNNRIAGNIEYYNRLTEDLIMSKTIPVTTGYSSVTANVGSVRNKGVEVALNTDNIKTANFSWRTSFNVAFNKNEIDDLQYKEDLSSRGQAMAGKYGDYSNMWIIGQPIDINYNLITAGVWQLDEAAEAAKYGCKPGQFKPLDLNEDDVIDNEDRVIDGKRTPDWTGGMTNTFAYKGFDLSFQLNFQTGAKMYNQFYESFALESNNQNFNNLKKDYWTPENPTNASAQPSNMGGYRNAGGSWGKTKSSMTHMMFKTDFLKVAHISMGYTFKQPILDKLLLSNLRAYVTVQNPFMFCEDYVYEPEHPSTNINVSDGITRNVLFGLNISLK